MKAFLTFLLFVPVFVFAAGEVVVVPESQHTITKIMEPEKEQHFYGELADYPHTFSFVVDEPLSLAVAVSVPKDSKYKKSIIVIREEKNGVSEVGRVTHNETAWTPAFDWRLGRGFLEAEHLTAEIEPGSYRLEVSSPDNHGKYKLMIGTESNRQWFFTRLKERATGARFFGDSWLSVLRAPLVTGTILVLMVLVYSTLRRIRRRYG